VVVAEDELIVMSRDDVDQIPRPAGPAFCGTEVAREVPAENSEILRSFWNRHPAEEEVGLRLILKSPHYPGAC